jgi:hypothetical protein
MSSSPGGGSQPNFIPGIGRVPNVSEGDVLSTAHINQLSDAVRRVAPASGSNFILGPAGVSNFTSVQPHKNAHPWMVIQRGTCLYFNVGQFFVDAPLAGGITQVSGAGGQVLAGGRNAWAFNSGFPGGPVYAFNPPEGMYMGGAEVWFEDKDFNVLTNTMVFQKLSGVFTKFKEGLFYLEYAPWGGRQAAPPYPNTSVPALKAQNDATTTFNSYSLKMKGRMVPQVRFAPAKATQGETSDMFSIKRMVYPICTVDKFGSIYQTLRSDVFHYVSMRDVAFQCSAIFDNGWKIAVTPGQVNGYVPKIGGKYLDELPAPMVSVTGAGRILIKVTATAGKFFPSDCEVVFQGGTTTPADTDSIGYRHIATVNMVSGVPGIVQLVSGNLLVNRFKMGQSGAVWAWNA